MQYRPIATTSWDAVVLLHGLFASRKSMRIAQDRLRAEGYFVVNWGYPTHRRSVAEHADRLLPILRRLQNAQQVRSINFLTHSFGGILARFALHQQEFSKLRRAVMLAPPNSGSHLAKLSLGPFHRIFPAIREISDEPHSLANQTPSPTNLQVGVIAASSDFIVRTANTHLPNQADHCIVRTSHFALPCHPDALDKSLHFLRTGKFMPHSLTSSLEALPVAA